MRVQIVLDSTGGNVDAALQIGRVVRRAWGTTFVKYNSKCYSSCALVYVAGVKRHNSGTIGLHRPYLANSPADLASIERIVSLMLLKLKSYVQEMGLTEVFYNEMIMTEPSSIKLYRQDIDRLVPTLDPGYDELITSIEARRVGISMKEMRVRKTAASRKCISPSIPYKGTPEQREEAIKNELACEPAISWGLSVQLFRERELEQVRCFLSDQERSSLQALRKIDRLAHPLTLKEEACIRELMLAPK